MTVTARSKTASNIAAIPAPTVTLTAKVAATVAAAPGKSPPYSE